MKYVCLTVKDDKLSATLAEYAATDWRLHTLTRLGDAWHVVMEKGI